MYCKHPKNYYLEVQHLINFDYHYLLVATINFPNAMYKWWPLHYASCALSLRFVFPVWKCGAKIPQKVLQIYLWTTCETFKNLLFHQYPILVISRKCDIKIKKWVYISLDKSAGQAWTSFCWITEKSQIIQLKISFHNGHFCVDFFKDANFVI